MNDNIIKQEEYTKFDKREEFDKYCNTLLEKLTLNCSLQGIPFFWSACVKNDDKESIYKNDIVGNKSRNIKLKDDQISKHIAVCMGFDPIVQNDNIEIDTSNLDVVDPNTLIDYNDDLSLYVNWFKYRSDISNDKDNISVISVPFLNMNGDYIKIYIRQREDQSYIIDDNGDTFSDVDYELPAKRIKKIEVFSKIFMLDCNYKTISCSVDNINDLAESINKLIQGIIYISGELLKIF